jgi:hypothetical protein
MITLLRSYNGFVAGAIVEFTAELEAALIAQGLALTSAGPVTPGAQSRVDGANPMIPVLAGTAAIAAAASSVVISNSAITANSKGFAQISQAAADGTATSIVRVSAAAGALTITANAAATAATEVSFIVFN